MATDEATRLNTSNAQADVPEESKEIEKKEDECFTTDEEKTLYMELIDLKDYVPEILLIPLKKSDKTQVGDKTQAKAENLEEIGEQQIQIRVLNSNSENPQTTECTNIFFAF